MSNLSETAVLRLTKLAELMERVFEEGQPFNLSNWKDDSRGAPLHQLFEEMVEGHMEMDQGVLMREANELFSASNPNFKGDVHDCGTVACAVGYAAQDEWFNHHGFVMATFAPAFEGYRNWAAVCRFFQVDDHQSRFLFSSDKYDDLDETNAKQVADRIREFLSESEVQP